MSAAIAATLKAVPFLAAVDEARLARLASRSRQVRYAPRRCLVSELESGADVFVILAGEAEVSVDAKGGQRHVLRKLGPGSAFGEMSSLTGALRSATVTAVTDVEALIIADDDFDRLREERPEVALALARELAGRLRTAEESLASLLSNAAPPPAPRGEGAVATLGKRGSIRRAWRELVVGRRQDCAFLILAAFLVTVVVVRNVVDLGFRLSAEPRDLFRFLYMSGFALVAGSACTSLLTFRPSLRRYIALAYGVGAALILNELGVTLAFDIYFKDIHTADPSVPFDLERLYHRAEPFRAIAFGVVVLVQAAYFRRFYARAAFVLRTRLRRASRRV